MFDTSLDFINEDYNAKSYILRYFAFDVDDNLLYMPTLIHLEKKIDDVWIPISISTGEFAKIRLNKSLYRFRDNDYRKTFCETSDLGPRGNRAFLEDVKIAVHNKDFGPSWNAFIGCLTEANIFSIITAREHESSSIRKAVEWIIDEYLDENQKYSLWNNALKFNYLFSENIERINKLMPSILTKTNIIKKYLDNCEFWGITSATFSRKFRKKSDMFSPEELKELALDNFIKKCQSFGRRINRKVKIGFSDDDVKNVQHIHKFFKERSNLGIEFSLFHASRDDIKKIDINETNSANNPFDGMQSSILPFTKWTNMTNLLYPKDNPEDPKKSEFRSKVELSDFLYKNNKRKSKKRLSKKINKKK